MHPTLCSRCKKNVAVIFITKLEAEKTTSEGYCLKCARELDLKPVDEIMKRMGLSEEELEGLSNEMMNAFDGMEAMLSAGQNQDGNEDEDDEDMSQTATFPFLNKLFGAGNPGDQLPANPVPNGEKEEKHEKHDRSGKNKKESSWIPTA